MKFSAKIDYGLIFMLSLRDFYKTDQFIGLSVISKEKNIPYAFLEQISKDLKMAGLIDAKKGFNGGYKLNRSPQKISLADIIFALEKKQILRCRKKGKISCKNYFFCDAKNVLGKIENEIFKILNKTTLDKI